MTLVSCMYMYIYLHTHTYVYIYINLYIYIYKHTHIYMCMFVTIITQKRGHEFGMERKDKGGFGVVGDAVLI